MNKKNEMSAANVDVLVETEESVVNLSDFALFLSVMKNEEAHRNILSIITDNKNLKLQKVHVEEVVLNKSGKRAIRLDAWAVDMDDRYYATEMQNDTDQDDVRKRSRFYQGLLDTPILKSGRETRYRNLPSSMITFITQDDIFGRDRAIYTFTERCEEVPELYLDDGTKKIFLNMSSRNGRPELVSLLQYMKNTTLDNPDITCRDERILDVDRVVQEVKQSEEWEAVRMSILSRGFELGKAEGRKVGEAEGRAKGRVEGKAEGKIEGRLEGQIAAHGDMILELLEEYGSIPDTVRNRIRNEKDLEILKVWSKTAAKSVSVDDFIKRIGEESC
ncbi:MAG: hypothetical protein LUD07_05020 [Clostridiales bacterium]|nr:hypothetical protein [Clostridiales bacterium]